MRLSLNTIKIGAIASLLALSATSCLNGQQSRCENAEAEASKYLTGEEYLRAKATADYSIKPSIQNSNNLVDYWDNLNTEYKVQRAYLEGAQMVRDSVANHFYTKPDYNMPISSYIKVGKNGGWGELDDLLKNVQRQVATNTDGLTIKKLLANQPVKCRSDYRRPIGSGFAKLHYWNEIISVGKQREAFNNGANAERAKLNKK